MNYQIGSEEVKHFKIDALVDHFLLTSYCYFNLKESAMTGGGYEACIERIKKEFNFISEEKREYLIYVDNLNKKLSMYPAHFNIKVGRDYINEVYSGNVRKRYATDFLPVGTGMPVLKDVKSLFSIVSS